mmetsp:Transcript_48148/g.92031  ORF Transcript_48148/g.92031 Transcript_48148/m.92031 type:complete len:281 (-) Transcript_48148:739-1581(-)
MHRVGDDVVDADGVPELGAQPRVGHARQPHRGAVVRVREGEEHHHRGGDHLDARQQVLQRLGVLGRGDGPGHHHEGYHHALPEGEEHHRLHYEELDHRIEGLEELLGSEVEEQQGVESHRVGGVVDGQDPHKPFVAAQLVRAVQALGSQHQREHGQHGLDHDELQGALLAPAQKQPVDGHGGEARRAQPPRALHAVPFHVHDHLPRPTHVRHAQGQKVVDHPGLVTVSDGVKVQLVLALSERQPRREGVHWDHEDETQDVALEGWMIVVTYVVIHLIQCS